MGRRLPWQVTGNSPRPVAPKIASDSAVSNASEVSFHASPSGLPSQTPIRKRPRPDDSDPIRSPSTSPPPAPPSETFMISGSRHDDRYRMVEDEMLHTARQFTTHLHRAEYNRLKALARSQNAGTIQEIKRPVVRSPTATARRRESTAKLRERQRKGLEGSAGAADDAARRPAPKGLRGLMESPRKDARFISSSVTGAAKTRAAAGFQSSTAVLSPNGRPRPSTANDDSETGDDITEVSPAPARRTTALPSSRPVSTDPRNRTWPLPSLAASSSATDNSISPSSSRPSVRSLQGQHGQNETSPARIIHVDDDDDDDPFGINKRKIHREKSRENLRKWEGKKAPKKSTSDTIPSFL